MRIYRDLDIVESLGSGIPRILRAYGEECFQFTDNFIRIIFPASVHADLESGPETVESGIEIAEGGTENTVKRILNLLKTNSRITSREIAGELNMARSGIAKHLNNLKSSGVIRRVGPKKGGHWEIVNNELN